MKHIVFFYWICGIGFMTTVIVIVFYNNIFKDD